MHSTALHIRSKDCTQLTAGFDSDLQVNLNTSIGGPNSDLHLSLVDAKIPHTWFDISSQMSNVTIQVDGVDSLVLLEASYDIYTLIDSVNASAFPYTTTFEESTSKVMLTNTDSTTHTINSQRREALQKHWVSIDPMQLWHQTTRSHHVESSTYRPCMQFTCTPA